MNQTDLIKLIESSPALQKDTLEKEYWLAALGSLNENGRTKLAAILLQEAQSTMAVLSAMEASLSAIAEEHASALRKFKQEDLPKFLRKWEATDRNAENADSILNEVE